MLLAITMLLILQASLPLISASNPKAAPHVLSRHRASRSSDSVTKHAIMNHRRSTNLLTKLQRSARHSGYPVQQSKVQPGLPVQQPIVSNTMALCLDKKPDICPILAALGECLLRNSGIVLLYCQKSCNKCPAVTPTQAIRNPITTVGGAQPVATPQLPTIILITLDTVSVPVSTTNTATTNIGKR